MFWTLNPTEEAFCSLNDAGSRRWLLSIQRWSQGEPCENTVIIDEDWKITALTELNCFRAIPWSRGYKANVSIVEVDWDHYFSASSTLIYVDKRVETKIVQSWRRRLALCYRMTPCLDHSRSRPKNTSLACYRQGSHRQSLIRAIKHS